MPEALDWARDGAGWPHRHASRFVDAGGVRWHVQTLGDGPALLLLHGTGASTHSWRDVAPLLATRWRVVMPDLPGHGFSSRGSARTMSLPGMSGALASLLAAIDAEPVAAIGHSAGAAIAVRMALDGRLAAPPIVSLNGAFVPFEGAMRALSPIARFLASTSLAARLAALRAHDAAALDRLLASTGSTLDARGRAFYARLVRNPGHVAGALAMMANWDLDRLYADLPRLGAPLRLVVGANDGTVPPAQAARVAAVVRDAAVERLDGLGHLMHEERPALLAALAERLIDAASTEEAAGQLSIQPDTVRSGHVDTRAGAAAHRDA